MITTIKVRGLTEIKGLYIKGFTYFVPIENLFFHINYCCGGGFGKNYIEIIDFTITRLNGDLVVKGKYLCDRRIVIAENYTFLWKYCWGVNRIDSEDLLSLEGIDLTVNGRWIWDREKQCWVLEEKL